MPSFDKPTTDSLIAALESGEADLAAKTAANLTATQAAAQAAADMTAAQATNRANVAAVKAFFAGLDDEGNAPDLPPNNPPVTENPPTAGGAPATGAADATGGGAAPAPAATA